MLENISNFIILIAAVLVAISTIARMLGKPFIFFKKKHRSELNKICKETLERELGKILTRYEQEITGKTKTIICGELTVVLESIKKMNEKQDDRIKILIKTTRDILRDRIVNIYKKGKETKTLSLEDKELLEEFYKDYLSQEGNGYITKIHNRMMGWDVVE